MPRTSRRVPLPADARAPISRTTPRERQMIDRVHDLVVPGRCPMCRFVLVARLGSAGPFFACGCGAASLDPVAAIVEDGEAKADKCVSTNPERKRGDHSTACCDAIPSLALRVSREPNF